MAAQPRPADTTEAPIEPELGPHALPDAARDAAPEELPPDLAAVAVESARKPSCTLAQLRRFIKSRPYVPLHELRRRFSIEGYEDDVSRFSTDAGPVYVGLPPEEARLLGELVRAGEVGFEVLRDPVSPAVVGVYPMRPVARP